MEFFDQMKNALDKGLAASKTALSKAGESVQNFSDKSVLRIEQHQLETKLNEEYVQLGKNVCEYFAQPENPPLTAQSDKIQTHLSEIKRLSDEIEKRKQLLESEKKEN